MVKYFTNKKRDRLLRLHGKSVSELFPDGKWKSIPPYWTIKDTGNAASTGLINYSGRGLERLYKCSQAELFCWKL